MSDFELNKAGWYELQNIELIEDFDPDQYGNLWYHAKFSGDADTHMWLAKEKPQEGKAYYGHFEPTKSGKKLRFKRDKEPEDVQRPSGAHSSPTAASRGSSKDITLGMVWKTVAGIRGLPEDDDDMAKFFEIVDAHLGELLKMSEKINNEAQH